MKSAVAALFLAAALCAQAPPPMTPAERAAASDREHERIIAEINAAMNSPAMQAAMADIEHVQRSWNVSLTGLETPQDRTPYREAQRYLPR